VEEEEEEDEDDEEEEGERGGERGLEMVGGANVVDRLDVLRFESTERGGRRWELGSNIAAVRFSPISIVSSSFSFSFSFSFSSFFFFSFRRLRLAAFFRRFFSFSSSSSFSRSINLVRTLARHAGVDQQVPKLIRSKEQ